MPNLATTFISGALTRGALYRASTLAKSETLEKNKYPNR